MLPPFWLTWWAYGTYIVIFAVFLKILLFLNTKRLIRQKKILEETVSEKTKKLIETLETISLQNKEISTQAEELRCTNEKLVELDTFKDNLTSMIVHDLKNPLNIILNFSEEAETKQAGKQMLNMVTNILDIQKFEEAKIKIQETSISLNQVINEALGQVKMLYERKAIAISKDIGHEHYLVCDYDLILRVFINILNNAIKYTPNNGKINIKSLSEIPEIIIKNELQNTNTQIQGNYLRITITDSGIGIPNDKLLDVFDKFTQIEARNSGTVRSTGIGLTFCRLAVEAHDGFIGVNSEPGFGSEFWLYLPKGDVQVLKINNENEDFKPEKLAFNKEDEANLIDIKQKLSMFTVFEISEIYQILKNFKPSSLNIEKWKMLLDNAIKACNEEKYNELIKIEIDGKNSSTGN